MRHELGAHGPAHNRLGARRNGMLPGTQVGIEQLIRWLSEGHRLLDCPRHSGLLSGGWRTTHGRLGCERGYSITCSARSRSERRIVEPTAFEVLCMRPTTHVVAW